MELKDALTGLSAVKKFMNLVDDGVTVGGSSVGETAFFLCSSGKGIVFCENLCAAIELKACLISLGKSADIYGGAFLPFEIGGRKGGEKLNSALSLISNYRKGELDFLIVTPEGCFDKLPASFGKSVEITLGMDYNKVSEILLSSGFVKAEGENEGRSFFSFGENIKIYDNKKVYKLGFDYDCLSEILLIESDKNSDSEVLGESDRADFKLNDSVLNKSNEKNENGEKNSVNTVENSINENKSDKNKSDESDENKSDENKPDESDENKSDENKSDENKSDENKSDENKSDEKKAGDNCQRVKRLEKIEILEKDGFTLSEEEVSDVIQKIDLDVKACPAGFEKIKELEFEVEKKKLLLASKYVRFSDSFFHPYFFSRFSSFIGDFCGDGKIFITEPKKFFAEIELLGISLLQSAGKLVQSGLSTLSHREFYFSPSEINDKIKPCAAFFMMKIGQKNFGLKNHIEISSYGQRKYVYDYKSLQSDLKFYEKNGVSVFLAAGSDSSVSALVDFLSENNIFAKTEFDPNAHGIFVTNSSYPKSAGFSGDSFLVIGTEDLVGGRKKTELTKRKKSVYVPKVGDLVVHEFHGIGRIESIERMKMTDSVRDYFVVLYAGGDKLYVPAEQADLLSLYLGGGEGEIKLNKIGGGEFSRLKERVKAGAKELAFDLLKLYKEREEKKGYVFPHDDLEDVFDASFEYESTNDQISATADIKADMESGKIMDRLVLGDVGFGKTEVALRAAFKAILAGKQVAFLCPTTILCTQHYETAKRRMESFGVRVASLSRLRSAAETKEILNRLSKGEIDLVVGTSSLLGKNVVFKDLGLLILDEEQRFGVGDKEKLKNIKRDVNVITMSATPIPRTLHMGLSGVRDISLIETPPKRRLPVQTFVAAFDEELLIQASKKELARGGQVIVVYNRVDKLESLAAGLRSSIEGARVGVAHGQMPERLLEKVIERLYNKDYDIIVASTIVENGIDLPSANTLFVVGSENMGLSQLYQLRGRVGRSSRLAYAYFTYDGDKMLPETVMRRLEALSEFTELGSGFKIAMKDLEIRGAGNLLGARQHGHLEKVGYEMYSRILSECVAELRGEEKTEKREIKLDISVSAFIPKEFIEDENERIRVYTEIAEVASEKEEEKLMLSLEEVYGPCPKEVGDLVRIAHLKNLGQTLGVKRIAVTSKGFMFELYKREDVVSPEIAFALEKNKDIAVLKFEKLPIIEAKTGAGPAKNLEIALLFLKDAKGMPN